MYDNNGDRIYDLGLYLFPRFNELTKILQLGCCLFTARSFHFSLNRANTTSHTHTQVNRENVEETLTAH